MIYKKPKIMDDLKINMPDTFKEEISEIHGLLFGNAMTLVARHEEWQRGIKEFADQYYLKKYMYLGEEHTFVGVREKLEDYEFVAYAILAKSSTDHYEIPLNDIILLEKRMGK